MIAALRCFCLPAASSPNLVSCVLSLLYLILLLWTTFCVRFRGLIYCTVCLTHSLPFVLHRWIWSFVSLCDYCIGVLLPAAAAFEIWKQCSQTSEVRYPETRWFQEMLRRAYKVRVCVYVCLSRVSLVFKYVWIWGLFIILIPFANGNSSRLGPAYQLRPLLRPSGHPWIL